MLVKELGVAQEVVVPFDGIVHRDREEPGVEGRGDFLGDLAVDGVDAPDWDEQHVDFADLLDELRGEFVAEIAEVAEGQAIQGHDEDAVEAALFAVPLVVVSAEGFDGHAETVDLLVIVDGLTFCHLGDLGHELSPQIIKQIGKIDVLLVPVGGIYTINGEVAKKVTAALNPRLFAIPMHYAVEGYDDLLTNAEFLDEQKNVKKMEDTNELSVSADMKPEGGYTVVVLGYKKAEPKKDK